MLLGRLGAASLQPAVADIDLALQLPRRSSRRGRRNGEINELDGRRRTDSYIFDSFDRKYCEETATCMRTPSRMQPNLQKSSDNRQRLSAFPASMVLEEEHARETTSLIKVRADRLPLDGGVSDEVGTRWPSLLEGTHVRRELLSCGH